MKALDKKLVRDLARLRGQVVTIALVVACGIASYVAIVGTYRSLVWARDTFYERTRFADVFADLTRAPARLAEHVLELPGIARVQTRVRIPLRLPLPDLTEPVSGLAVSLDVQALEILDRVQLSSGRMPGAGRKDEVLVNEAFARAHALRLGDALPMVLEGVRRQPRIVGFATSPDYVFPIGAGELSFDPATFAIVWMERGVLERATRMEGAFNRISVSLQPGASRAAVIEALNRALAPYGGRLARGRDRHPSNALLDGELAQLETLAAVIPFIFLGVAAFLVNVVLSRLVALERSEIAVLKAVGYPNRRIGLHYVKLVSLVVLLGAVLGTSFGLFIGIPLVDLYVEYFHLPNLSFRFDASLAIQSIVVSLFAAIVGSLASARSVMRLPPAEAMRPPEPPTYKRRASARASSPWIGPSTLMVAREIARHPLRTLTSALGISMAVAILVVGRFSADAISHLLRVQFEVAQREDVTVRFARAQPERSVRALRSLPGVLRSEPMRELPVRVQSGHLAREAVLHSGHGTDTLRRIVDADARPHTPPERGVMLSRKLAEILRVEPGDPVVLETLEDDAKTRSVHVTATVDDLFGLNLYMQPSALRELLGEPPLATVALLRIDPRAYGELVRRLADMPQVLGVDRVREALARFEEQTAGQMRVTTAILTAFAAIIAAGIIYNNARVALSTRARDLSSLRVLGYRRSEISAVLLWELALQVLLALAPGMLFGRQLVMALIAGADPETYRFPPVISAATYAFAASITLAAALASALLVRRRLDRLDLIAVLKTRE